MIRPKLVGIVNLTPDSFSGDGRQGEEALSHAKSLIAAGADMLDIGAESTRPGAVELAPDEEWARLEPFLKAYQEKTPLSIDTRYASTAVKVRDYGTHTINDVSGLTGEKMRAVLAQSGCDIIVMHSLTVPADKNVVWPAEVDPIEEILKWKSQITASASAANIDTARLIFDPGLGFGKTPGQSLVLVARASELVASGGRWLFGHSRKSFLTMLKDVPAEERDPLTLDLSAMLGAAGVHYLRIHNVEAHRALFDR